MLQLGQNDEPLRGWGARCTQQVWGAITARVGPRRHGNGHELGRSYESRKTLY